MDEPMSAPIFQRVTIQSDIIVSVIKDGPTTTDDLLIACALVEQQFNSLKIETPDFLEGTKILARVHMNDVQEKTKE